jgi:hypothetical protein
LDIVSSSSPGLTTCTVRDWDWDWGAGRAKLSHSRHVMFPAEAKLKRNSSSEINDAREIFHDAMTSSCLLKKPGRFTCGGASVTREIPQKEQKRLGVIHAVPCSVKPYART